MYKNFIPRVLVHARDKEKFLRARQTAVFVFKQQVTCQTQAYCKCLLS